MAQYGFKECAAERSLNSRDVLIRLPQVRHGQKDRKDQGQGSAKCGGMARFFAFLYGELCIVQ